jgi:MFS family permease
MAQPADRGESTNASPTRQHTFRFVLWLSIVSLFGDMTYEGARSVSGPFLAHLGASGFVVGFVAGFGELIGFAMRYLSGSVADRTRRYWPIAIAGYAVNVLTVPALALARTWPVAALLIVGERFGRGVRKPVVGAMLAHAGSELGQGWVFGFRESMDQTGATIGPLIVALVLFFHGGFSLAFSVLAIPAVLMLVVLIGARREYPRPQDLETARPVQAPSGAGAFWLYAAGGACLAAGFADFALVSYHFSRTHLIADALIPVLYAGAMLVGAVGSPFLGKAFDRYGIVVVVAAFLAGAAFAPLVFLGSFWFALLGVLLWGLGMAAQDALLPSLIARIAPPERRASLLGAFDACYGVAWFVGSTVMGALYDRSIVGLVVVSLVLQVVCAPPLFLLAARRQTRAA